MEQQPSNVVCPNNNDGERNRDPAAETETADSGYKGFTALSNPIFRQAIDSSANPAVCIENFWWNCEYEAIVLALDDTHALVSLHLDRQWVPMTCRKNVIPSTIASHRWQRHLGNSAKTLNE